MACHNLHQIDKYTQYIEEIWHSGYYIAKDLLPFGDKQIPPKINYKQREQILIWNTDTGNQFIVWISIASELQFMYALLWFDFIWWLKINLGFNTHLERGQSY